MKLALLQARSLVRLLPNLQNVALTEKAMNVQVLNRALLLATLEGMPQPTAGGYRLRPPVHHTVSHRVPIKLSAELMPTASHATCADTMRTHKCDRGGSGYNRYKRDQSGRPLQIQQRVLACSRRSWSSPLLHVASVKRTP